MTVSEPIHQAPASPLLHGWAVAVAGVILTMIVAGGLVTSQNAGDSVPDWPLSYGSVYPTHQMVGNVRYEHTHRMIGWALGLMVIALTVALQATRKPPGIRRMGWIALLWVCLLGGLGGLRVMLISKPAVQDAVMNVFGLLGVQSVETARVTVTVIHTALAQSFLCFMVVLAATLSRRWNTAQQPAISDETGGLRRLAMVTIAMVLMQLVFGALRRQTDATWPLILHLVGAGLVFLHVALIILRIRLYFSDVAPLRRIARGLGILIVAQVALGLAAWWIVRANKPGASPLPEIFGSDILASTMLTAHLAVGAMVLVLTVLAAVYAYKYVAPTGDATDRTAVPTPGPLAASP